MVKVGRFVNVNQVNCFCSVVSNRTEKVVTYGAAGCVKCCGASQQFFSEDLAAVTLNLEGVHVVSIVLCMPCVGCVCMF